VAKYCSLTSTGYLKYNKKNLSLKPLIYYNLKIETFELPWRKNEGIS